MAMLGFGKGKGKDLGLAEALATVSIKMVFDGPGGDLIIKKYSDNKEYLDRFMLALAIGHAAMATAAQDLNLSIDPARKTFIHDHMVKTFTKKMSEFSGSFPVSKYIVADHEVKMIESEFGNCDFTTNMKKLLGMIYDSRVAEYESALKEGLDRAAKDDGARINPFLKMVKAMGKHVYGDEQAMDKVFISQLSSVMFACLQSMMSVCEEYE